MSKPENNLRVSGYVKMILSAAQLLLLVFLMVPDAKAQSNSKSTSIFDGKSLQGWETVNPEYEKFWSVQNGVITGGDGSTKIPANTYLHTTDEYEDFEFRCLFRLTGDPETGMINSGIQYRSTIHDGEIVGYQADIGNGYWGDIYDEHRRAKLVDGDMSLLTHLLNKNGWNSYIIRVKGDHHELYINGVKTADYVEKDAEIPSKGVIGFQVHGGGAAKVEFRAPTITELN